MKHFALLQAALRNILRHQGRSIAILLCLLSILSPFLSALALLEGVKSQSRLSVQEGADLYVTMDLFGRNGVIPLDTAAALRRIDGVIEAVPRIIGRIYLQDKPAVLLGIPAERRIDNLPVLRGTCPGPGEIAIGLKLAQALGLDVGDSIGIGVQAVGIINNAAHVLKKLYRISGIFTAGADIRTADLVLMDVAEAGEVYGMDGFASDIALTLRKGGERSVSEQLIRMNSSFRIQSRQLVNAYVERGLNTRGGIFAALYAAAFAVAIPAILVSSGMGFSERKREIGLLKATGWRNDEILEMAIYENVLYAVIGASAALLLSFLWLRLLNGVLIARLFISGIGDLAPFPVPSQFLPVPFFGAMLAALSITLAGSLSATWRMISIPPAEALR